MSFLSVVVGWAFMLALTCVFILIPFYMVLIFKFERDLRGLYPDIYKKIMGPIEVKSALHEQQIFRRLLERKSIDKEYLDGNEDLLRRFVFISKLYRFSAWLFVATMLCMVIWMFIDNGS